MIDHHSYAHNLSSCEITVKPEKISGLNGIRTYDLCDTGAILYQLSYQAVWEQMVMTTSEYTIYGYITNSQSDQHPAGLIAQLLEHCTSIAEVLGWNPVHA